MIQFFVQGSSATPYRVSFTLNEGNLNAFCTCPAGKNGQFCKHRMSILRGESDTIVSSNKGEVSIIRDWLAGSDVEMAIHEIAEAEYGADEAKRRLVQAKRNLAKAMHKNSL